jgi:4-amino-4-deoxy-L-arabinose transferase-like glycosyltransferase
MKISDVSSVDGRWHPWLLLALAFALLLPGNGSIPLIDRDEPRFAQSTREMIDSGSWIVPTFNGEERLHKPILTYWMMRASYAVFGVNEFGARFHSVACAASLAAVIYLMGRRWYSARAGLVAASAILTCLQMVLHGRSCVADLPMILFVATSQWAIFELLAEDAAHKRKWFWMLYVSLGLGFLAKGPVAWIVPGLALVLYRWVFLRKPLPWMNLKPHLGVPVVLAIIGAWGIPALVETQGRFWSVGIGEHIVERGTKAFNKRGFTPFYYLLVSLVFLYPWSCYAPRALVRGWKDRTPVNAFLLAWFVAPFIVFSFYATQLPHYVMPGYPALFLLFGTFVGKPAARWERAWKTFVLGAGLVVAAVALAGAWLARQPLDLALAGVGILLVGLTVAATRFRIAGWAVMVFGVLLLGWGLRPMLPAIQLQQTFASLPPDAKFGCWAYREPSLMFYSNRRWEEIRDVERAKAFLQEPGPRLLVVPAEYYDLEDIIRGRSGPSKEFSAENGALLAIATNAVSIEGINIARSQIVWLRAYYKVD